MSSPDVQKQNLWTQIRTDLQRARNTLPSNATDHAAISQYEEFLSHNELQLACEMLESYGQSHTVSKEFWVALRDAAAKMNLSGLAGRYEGFASGR